MTDTPSTRNAPASPSADEPVVHARITSELGQLLGAQAARLRRRFVWHGLCTTALLVLGAIALFFLLDHSLRLPQPIRLLHSAATIGLVVFCAWRFVHYPAHRPLLQIDVAEVLERSFPALHQRLVSAIQLQTLQGDALRGQSRAMVDALLDDTRAAIATLPLAQLFERRRTRQLASGAGGLAIVLLLAGLSGPQTARAFVLRHLGFDADYPRNTYLEIELPPASADLHREDRPGETLLMLSAGADLHVSVLARGEVPKDAFLDVRPLRGEDEADPDERSGSARSIPLTPRPGDRFRHVFRRISGTFEFRARGGDDERGDRRVLVRTVHPAQVATIAARVQPPAYTGSEVLEQPNGAIEGLVGSGVQIEVTTTAGVRSAVMSFLESGARIPLEPVAMLDDSGVAATWRGKFTITTSDRYEIELVAENGLNNPNPGNYPISALVDYAPVGRWLLPDDESLLLVPEAMLCLRLELRDDFGLQSVRLLVENANGPALDTQLLANTARSADGTAPLRTAVATEFFEVKELIGPARGTNDGLSLQVSLADIRAPEANTTELPRRIVQIVDSQQLAAAIAKMFRSLREETERTLEIQRDRRNKLEELLSPEGSQAATAMPTLTGIEVGQARIASSANRLSIGLMRSFDLHLWNRLEPSPNAARVVDLYRRFSRDLREPLALDPAFYRELARLRAAGTLGALETTLDPILAMVSIADTLASTECATVMRQLAEAEVARADNRRTILEQALASQDRIQGHLQQLLLRLEEWNDFQDLIQETRALRDRQRDLQTRTEEVKGK